jgi:large subunit ribosomal protein L25
MRKDITIVAEARPLRGGAETGRLRRQGKSPAVVYGPGNDAIPVAVNPKEVNKILHSSTGHNTIFNLDIAGRETTPVMIVDWQHDPVRGSLLHIDLKRIDLTKRLVVKVPVHTEGEPKGVKIQGGSHEVVNREIEVECLPDEIPENFTVQVGELMLNQAVRAGDIPMPGTMKLRTPAELLISHVVAVKAEAEPAPAADAAAAAPTTAEPEVIKKGKKEEAPAEAADAKKKK